MGSLCLDLNLLADKLFRSEQRLPMSVQTPWPQAIDFFGSLDIRWQTSAEQFSHDGGLLLFRQLDERLGFTRDFAAALDDPRDPGLREHSFLEMTRQRVFAILADYEDQNDAEALRADPVFKLVCGRRPDGPDLASQPTLSRFENSISVASLKRLRRLFVEHFIASFKEPPRRLTFDLDAVDDPAHGEQQLTFWHNYYDQNQYLPLVISCAENDLLVSLSLRHGSASAALGADDDLEYVVTRIRAAWPDVAIFVRADAAFGIPSTYDVCERLRLTYCFGLQGNAVLQRRTQELLDRALAAWQAERLLARERERPAQPVRLFEGFWYRAGSWQQPRFVVAKAEANEQGSQRRFVVTNRAGAPLFPEPSHDEYAARGESENRFKEGKCDLHVGRPVERPPVLRQLLPAVPARPGAEPAGEDAPAGGAAGASGSAARVAARCGGGRAEEAAVQPETAAGRAGRRAAGDVAAAGDQGGGAPEQQRQAGGDRSEQRVALPGAVPAADAAATGCAGRAPTSHTRDLATL